MWLALPLLLAPSLPRQDALALQNPPVPPFAQRTIALSGDPRALVLRRLDAGAVPDLAVLLRLPGGVVRLTVLEGLGGGRFAAAWTNDLGLSNGVGARTLKAFDVDADGRLDLAAPGVGQNNEMLWLGAGDLTFPERIQVPTVGGDTMDVTFADFSGDGLLDSMVLTRDLGGFFVDTAVNQGEAGFGQLSFAGVPTVVGTQRSYLLHADLDGDGDPADLVVASETGLVKFGYAPSGPRLQVFPGDFGEPVAVDLDGDGDLDLAVPRPARDGVTVFENLGAGDLAPSARIATGPGPQHLAAADLDNDGDPDLAVTNEGGATLTVLRNAGGGVLHALGPILVGQAPGDVEAADLDLDGDVDLVVADRGDETLTVLLSSLVP